MKEEKKFSTFVRKKNLLNIQHTLPKPWMSFISEQFTLHSRHLFSLLNKDKNVIDWMPSLKLADAQLIEWRSPICYQCIITYINIRRPMTDSHWLFSLLFYVFNKTPPQFTFWKDFEGRFLKCCTLAFSQIWLFFLPKDISRCQDLSGRSISE